MIKPQTMVVKKESCVFRFQPPVRLKLNFCYIETLNFSFYGEKCKCFFLSK